ncbi:adenosylmethionine--8-amino-7-oxononanoate transaminase [Geomesophilobacter sediminis]|uniref:Adenosylmethionine-8-amino-7-oxononanoate aminotransferase n=1 Tax=Geomesophilobacter sediminis TaxID=2798584 RepID=A0A8J7JKF7_9BACT|nr:adenosylmethionine--8-amino-7-oxononanoate transaminase [Geomesophilobacter sediminis]MBJ6723860.1 adenosylmethionine--8-amino-7-oxononanoate transaminase [Geomesophilobacter sediminis]
MHELDTATLRKYDSDYLWHPFTQMSEWEGADNPVITHGEGSYLIDSDGNRYLDGVAALWTNVHGHCKKEINEAIKEQVDRLEHSTLLGLTNDRAALLAKRLVDIAPSGLCKVFYSDNGSTAVEIGVKMAFQYQMQQGKPGKTKFIAFDNAYHGDTVGSMSVGGIDIYHATYKPLLFPTIKAPSTYCYRCSLCEARDPKRCGMECLKELERLMEEHAPELAGLVIEPAVQGAGGMIVQPEGYLKKVRELCDRYDVLMVADEVAVGFGRTGAMFACAKAGITPDIMALSKGISAGYLPLAATLTTRKVYDAFWGEYAELKTFFHGHTFTGNPIACAAALANLDLFESERLLENLVPKIAYLKERLQGLLALPHVGDVRHEGMIGGIELVRDRESRDPYPWEERVGVRVCLEARKHGLFLRPLGNVIVVFPPLSISMDELKILMDGIEKSIVAITGE